ncbi:MAG: helix-turn-helix transcriptional regulator [Oceanospirillaceae bacterium]|nr:helix-turn-helix transcriptional regulator [Oceanospirillaceae bacterium]
MNQALSQNLRLLCSYYKSIAEVCRRLGISRPQFNRYLSGKHRPAANTLRKICDFFGVEEHEILLPHSQFQRLVQVRPKPQREQQLAPEHAHLARLQQKSSSDIDKYLGYYFEYCLSMSAPGKILRSLVCFERREGSVYYQRTERLVDIESKEAPASHCKYLGMAFLLVDRIFMIDYESIAINEISQTIIFPTFKSRVSKLQGFRTGVSARGDRMPSSTRVCYEYLGAQASVTKALKLCGLYPYDSSAIDASIRANISNDFDPKQWLFRAK